MLLESPAEGHQTASFKVKKLSCCLCRESLISSNLHFPIETWGRTRFSQIEIDIHWGQNSNCVFKLIKWNFLFLKDVTACHRSSTPPVNEPHDICCRPTPTLRRKQKHIKLFAMLLSICTRCFSWGEKLTRKKKIDKQVSLFLSFWTAKAASQKKSGWQIFNDEIAPTWLRVCEKKSFQLGMMQ